MTKGPNGNNAATRISAVQRSDHRRSSCAINSNMQKVMNRMPCIQPASFTASGMPAKYLSGMATPSKRRKETPSSIAATRKRPTVDVIIIGIACRSIRTRQLGFVDFHPGNSTAPVAVGRGFSRRQIVESAGGHDGARAVTRRVRDRTIAIAANLPGKALRFRQIEAFDQIFALSPAKLPNRHGDVG